MDAAFIALVDERVMARLMESAVQFRLDVTDPEEVEARLTAWFVDLAGLVDEEGPLFRAALLAAPTGTGRAAAHCRDLIEQMRQWGQGVLEPVQGTAPFRGVDAAHVSRMVLGMTLHCVVDGLAGRSRVEWAREMARFEAWGLMGGPATDCGR